MTAGRTPRAFLAALTIVLAVSCAGLLLLKATSSSVLPDSWFAADHASDRDRDVTIAARTFTQTFLTYDYRTMDKDVSALKAMATGKFKADFETYQVQASELAKTQKSVSKGGVVRVGIGTVDDGEAVVDVAATKVETSSVSADGKATAKSRESTSELYFHLTMHRVGGRWLVADLEVGRVA